jgi:hypothetical protein
MEDIRQGHHKKVAEIDDKWRERIDVLQKAMEIERQDHEKRLSDAEERIKRERELRDIIEGNIEKLR